MVWLYTLFMFLSYKNCFRTHNNLQTFHCKSCKIKIHLKKDRLSPNLQLYFMFSLFKKRNYREFKLMVGSTVTVFKKHLHTLPNIYGLEVRVSILVTLAFLSPRPEYLSWLCSLLYNEHVRRGGDKLRVNLSELESNILSTVRRRGERTALKTPKLSPTWLVANKYTNNLQAALLRLCCN
jgi:hypothetical protein